MRSVVGVLPSRQVTNNYLPLVGIVTNHFLSVGRCSSPTVKLIFTDWP
ncbi:MAG: hypothetical protein U0289_06645 [Cyclobacteriaceae bacterium]|jgi:DNA topoisomerase IA|nr:hypothetical protein [Cyclobacteriaceae bacterium]